MRITPPFAAVLLSFVLAAVLQAAPAAGAADSFPVEIQLHDAESGLQFGTPISITTEVGTLVKVASVDGQLLRVDIEDGAVSTANTGGDNQQFGGTCIDSRGDTTLYATGRESGKVFAFDSAGNLRQTYQLAEAGSVFLAGCIQSQYHLLITDAKNPNLYTLTLSDDPEDGRGDPAPVEEYGDAPYQGYKLDLEGDWEQDESAAINAFGVEWTQNFERTQGFIVNSATGKVYSIPVAENGVDGTAVVEVNVIGQVTSFPGAMGVLFDSRDETVMYITMPHLNAIAVLEFINDKDMIIKEAKFIRYLQSPLTNGPVSVGEYGDYLFAVSYKKRPPNTNFTLVRMPRHVAHREPGENFTTLYDDDVAKPKAIATSDEVWKEVLAPPEATGRTAPPPVTGEVPSPSPTPTMSPSPTPTLGTTPEPTPVAAEDGLAADDDDKPPQIFSGDNPSEPKELQSSCFPAGATVLLRNGRHVRMDMLQIGDEVSVGVDERSGNSIFSAVYAFSHRDPHVVSRFVSLHLKGGQQVVVSPGHYLPTGGALRAAEEVRVGERVLCGDGLSVPVEKVEEVFDKGLYNPHTLAERVVVDGVVASTFTKSVAPSCAVALLAPLRALGAAGWGLNEAVSRLLRRGAGPVEGLLVVGRSLSWW